MITNAPSNDAKQQQQTVDRESGQDFEAAILTALEISAYDLEVLERYLIEKKMIPTSTDEDATKDTVYKFRKSYVTGGYFLFASNPRLNKLFNAWNDENVESWVRKSGGLDVRARSALKLRRETDKYNAVRALIAHLAAREED